MKLYKNAANQVFAYDADGSQDAFIPADQVPITQAEADALRSPPFAELKELELADFRSKREMFLNRVAGIGFAAQQAGDQVTVDAAVSVRQGLLDLPASAPVQAATDLPTLHAAIKAQYAAVVGAVPDAARAAFAKVDA